MPKTLSVAQAPKKTYDTGQYIFQLSEKIEPRVKGGIPYPPIYDLPRKINVFDEEKNMTRQMRVVDGCPTPWVDEQQELRLDEKRADETAWEPRFHNGTLVLNSPQDDLKILYMMSHDGFKSKKIKSNANTPEKFFVVNENEGAQESLDMLKETKKATDRAWEAIEDFDSIEAHARHMGVLYTNSQGKPRSPEAIKSDYIRKAQTDPKNFNKYFNNPLVEIKNTLREAVEQNIITTTHIKGQAHWADTKVLITELDPTKDANEQLLLFATSDKGTGFLTQVRNMVK